MLRVGLTGGLASGKSFVGRALQELGCLLIKADDLGHSVIEPISAVAPILSLISQSPISTPVSKRLRFPNVVPP